MEETFLAEMRNDLAVRVPYRVRGRLGLKPHQLVRVTIDIEIDKIKMVEVD